MSSILCIQVQVQADSQANELGHLHTDQVDRGVDSFHHLAPPSSLSFVRSHNTSIIPRLPGRILQLSARSPCYTIGSFVSCSSHFPGPGPGPVRILMLCGTVHAFNNIHPNATIQPSATCLATSQRVVIHQQMIGYSYKENHHAPRPTLTISPGCSSIFRACDDPPNVSQVVHLAWHLWTWCSPSAVVCSTNTHLSTC
jgi:hypothetical protein